MTLTGTGAFPSLFLHCIFARVAVGYEDPPGFTDHEPNSKFAQNSDLI